MITDCPEPTPISIETQRQAAVELEGLGETSAIGTVLAAALDDRDKLRACRSLR